jgi:hypothetical protein
LRSTIDLYRSDAQAVSSRARLGRRGGAAPLKGESSAPTLRRMTVRRMDHAGPDGIIIGLVAELR